MCLEPEGKNDVTRPVCLFVSQTGFHHLQVRPQEPQVCPLPAGKGRGKDQGTRSDPQDWVTYLCLHWLLGDYMVCEWRKQIMDSHKEYPGWPSPFGNIQIISNFSLYTVVK